MLHRALATVSFVCCAVIIASFAFFAVDQMSGASQQQVAETAGTAVVHKAANPDRHQPRRFLDSVANALTSPFSSLLHTESKWADHLFLLVCGLALYGVGLGFLSRYTAGFPLRQ
ncbi:MAG TPA: hypothetical protein VKR21_01790 [Solirubrobacteraceae bacterium]|nr:hypothetical protein [Solirubrobacteraceae bacterium]